MKFILFIIAIIFIIFFLSKIPQFDSSEIKVSEVKTERSLKIGDQVLRIEIAKTPKEREQGLSGKKNLDADQGLLFIFEQEGYPGFWMKDMNFPIDIAWLDKDKKIVHIEHEVSPQTYPKIFGSDSPSLYVLETSSSFFKGAGIKIGDRAEF